MEFQVEAMSCGHCVNAVTQAVKSVDPQAQVEVDLAAHKVRVETAREESAVVRALTEAGYPPSR